MSFKGILVATIACLFLPVTPLYAEDHPVVGTEGRSSRDFYMQYPIFNGKWAIIYHNVDKNATATGGGYDGFSLKIYHGKISNVSTYSIYGIRGDLDYSDPANPVTTRRDYTIGYGLEANLGSYFVLDGRAHLAYDDLAGGVSPEFHLRFGYRVLPASGQQAHSGTDIEDGVEFGFELTPNLNLYLQFPYADYKKAYVVYVKWQNDAGQQIETFGLDLKKYRKTVAGFEIFTQLGFNFTVNGYSFIFPDVDTVISYGIGVEKMFDNHFVISGTSSIANIGESDLKAELRVRVGYRM
jgi:hypothetical protein